jgi:hypothetical protein
MDNYPVKRTPEQGHTARCLAKALIAAIENYRDDVVGDAERMGKPWIADYDFRLRAQENGFLWVADGYLEEGLTECICPDEEGAEKLREEHQATFHPAVLGKDYIVVDVLKPGPVPEGGLLGELRRRKEAEAQTARGVLVTCYHCGQKVERRLEGWMYDHYSEGGQLCIGSGTWGYYA